MLSGAILDERQEKGGVGAGLTRVRQTRLHRHDLSGTELE
jgi:hypothetical protein